MGVEFCQNIFSVSPEMIIWFSFFSLFVWCITLTDLHHMKNPWISEMNSTWSWCMMFLMCCCILFATVYLRIFASVFISNIGLQFSFFVIYLSGFGIRVMMGIIEWAWEGSLLCSFGEEFGKDGYSIQFAYEAIWYWTFVSWKFFFF